MEVYSALFIEYTDDYKLRGSMPADVYMSIFATRKEAEEFVSKHAWDNIKDIRFTEEEIAGNESYFEKTDEGDYVFERAAAGNCYDHLILCESMAKTEGEFVPIQFEGEVQKWEFPQETNKKLKVSK